MLLIEPCYKCWYMCLLAMALICLQLQLSFGSPLKSPALGIREEEMMAGTKQEVLTVIMSNLATSLTQKGCVCMDRQ